MSPASPAMTVRFFKHCTTWEAVKKYEVMELASWDARNKAVIVSIPSSQAEGPQIYVIPCLLVC